MKISGWDGRLLELGLAVRRHLLDVLGRGGEDFAQPVACEGGDTIFALDRHVEPVLEREIESWPDELKPILVIAEGCGADGRRRFGAGSRKYRLIVDPIDGTRGLMYDKRPAWFIAAVAPDRGEETTLADTFAAALVELPTSKQLWADSFTAVAGEGVKSYRARTDVDFERPLAICPSSATSLLNGFAHVANFFPGVKILASELLEHIAQFTVGEVRKDAATVFDDQYISTAGQMVEIMLGRDRFCCDLRPLLYQVQLQRDEKSAAGLACHPYDVAGWLIAQEAGIIVTDGFGRRLQPKLDVHTPVHWCGYANRILQSQIQPLINAWLAARGVCPD